jgi:hypothetical protein
VTYPRGLEHTSDGGPAKHPEGNPEPPKAKQIAANQQKTRFLENYGEGRDANRQPALLDAALWYAGLGLPVLPLHWIDDQGRCSCNGKPGCKPGKHPLIPNGHLGATTDPGQIRRWWSRWPEANIGIPTGERSGLLVLDVDADDHGFTGLIALQEEHGQLPETLTVRTGGGGKHIYLKYPAGCEIRNSVGRLGLGLDVRGEGGYIVAPPSRTDKGSYEFLDRLPSAEPPEWFLEAARTPYRAATAEYGAKLGPPRGSLSSATLDGGSIPERTRNSTLTSIAGRLHDGSRDLAALTADLLDIRNARCENPDTFTDAEVLKIARSIHPRPPCKKTGPVPTREVMEALDEIEAEIWRREWPGMGGKSERDAYVALLKAAREYGEMIPSGVRVSIGLRSWALASAVSKRAMLDYWKKGERKPGIISRLKMRGLLRADNAGRNGTNAGAFVLLLPPRAEFHHSATREVLRTTENASGETLRAPRLRWSAPRYARVGDEYIRTTIRRLGKNCGAVIDALERVGGIATVEELADALHKTRARDLRRRTIARLDKTGVVECSGDTVALTGDWLSVLNREREIAGEIAAYRRDMASYAREREAYRRRDTIKPEPVPERLPAGTIDELERVEDADPALVEALAIYLYRHPRRAGETPSWLAVALWADELVEGKPTPAAIEVALHELVERRAA